MSLAKHVCRLLVALGLGAVTLTGCVTTVHGLGERGVLPAPSSTAPAAQSADPKEQMLKQCAVALTTAKGFLNSWKDVAGSGINPSAEQRVGLAGEIQTYVDQLNSQLPAMADQSLIGHVQSMVTEMNTLVQGLGAGIGVDLNAYYAAVKATTDYCQ